MSRFQQSLKKDYRCSKDSQSKEKICFFRLNLFICFLILFFIVAYIIQVNGLTNLNYQLKQTEAKLSALEENNSKLELEAAKLESTSRLKTASQELGFVEIDKVKYLNASEVVVASIK